LDNITETNRQFVDQRLQELTGQRQQLVGRLEELDLLTVSKVEVRPLVDDTMKFLSGLTAVLREGLPQEKLVALRQCIERIWIDKPAGQITMAIRIVPAGNLQAHHKLVLPVPPTPESGRYKASQSGDKYKGPGVISRSL
jgi:hypothetical protein